MHQSAKKNDGKAAVLVPQNVEKVPLYHWCPSKRLLLVGSRDGASFSADDDTRDNNSFQRTLTAPLLSAAHQHAGTDGLCADWGSSLAFPTSCRLLAECAQAHDGALVICSNGHGDANLLDELLPQVDAWSLLVHQEPGPLCQRILTEGKHVEIQLAWTADTHNLPPVEWGLASCVHIVPLSTNDPQDYFEQARALLPAQTILYDERHQHSSCTTCGSDLIWRHRGSARLDAIDTRGDCSNCGTASTIKLQNHN